MIDKHGKLFKRFSIIDLIIVLAVIVIIAGFTVRQLVPRLQNVIAPSDTFYVQVEGTGLRHFITDEIHIGDVVARQFVHTIGTVVDVAVSPAMDYLHRANGTAMLVPMEQRYNILITIQAIGSINDNGFFINGTDRIAPGSEIALHSNRVFIPDGRVQSISTTR